MEALAIVALFVGALVGIWKVFGTRVLKVVLKLIFYPIFALLLFLALFVFVNPFEHGVAHVNNKFFSGKTFAIVNVLSVAKSLLWHCAGDMKGCAYNEIFVEALARDYGWAAPGVAYQTDMSGTVQSNYFSHAAVKRVAHDPKMKRASYTFVMGNGTKMVENGFFDAPILPSMLNLATDDPERLLRRDLIAEMIVATEQAPPHGKIAKFTTPAFINVSAALDFVDTGTTSAPVYQMVWYNLFNMAFGIQLDMPELLMIQDWLDVLNPCIVNDKLCPYDQGPRVYEITKHFSERLMASDVGRAFLAKAAEKGMDGPLRLYELTVVFLFAGCGGTGGLAWQTVHHLLHAPLGAYSPEQVEQCVSDPAAVILEGARKFPPVLGINPFVYREDKQFTVGNGRTVIETAGQFGLMSTNGANHDPAVFGGPESSQEYAMQWKPGRENAEKIMTWGNELAATKTCPTAAGCAAAPRPCPGAHLALRLGEKVMQHFCELKLKATSASSNSRPGKTDL